MFTDTCQKVFDFFTIFADLLIREPINDKDWLNIACLTSILFVIMILGCIGSALLDVPDDNKNYVLYSVLHQSKIIAGLASLITAIKQKNVKNTLSISTQQMKQASTV